LLHVTLKFLGEVEPARVDELTAIGAEVAGLVAPHEVTFEGVGAFPNLHHPRVVWFGMTHTRGVERIAAELESRTAAAGFAADERAFSPHVTVARIKHPPTREVVASLTAHANAVKAHVRMPVTAFELIRSTPTARGARYHTLASFALGGS
jgi:2'-5' RNA ligase